MKYKAIFFDFDGTLSSFRTFTVPQSALEAIDQARANGVKVFLATGRHPMIFMSNDKASVIPFDGYLTANGQYCYNREEIIHRMYIPREDKEQLVEVLKEMEVPVLFLAQKEIYINMVDHRVDEANKILRSIDAPIGPARRCLDQDILALLLFGGMEEEERIMKVMPGSKTVRWYPLFTDIIPRAGGKDVGIDHMLAYYNISPEETIAFGDAQNDLDMIKHVGLGIAMGNAADYLKEVADYVTDDVDDDGVYNALKKYGVI